MSQAKKNIKALNTFDVGLLLAVFTLLVFGLLMQFSASISISEYTMHDPFYYFKRQAIYVLLALFISGAVFNYLSLQWFEKMALPLMVLALILLTLVLIPGIGSKINGSSRWLSLGVINVQAAEVAKLCCVLYFAYFFGKHHGKLPLFKFQHFFAPLLLPSIALYLLYLEPDFGSMAVVLVIAFALLFIAGYPLIKLFLCAFVAGVGAWWAVASSPYRMLRVTSFSDPWKDPFDSGFQLSQSLIAFGRGEITGTGFGASIQKYAYLPEAHTDFIFAVLGEELGVIGVCFIIALFLFITLKIVWLGFRIIEAGKTPFSGYLVMGIGLWIGLQASVNMAVSLGSLPTKGITLPLVSYGGSSVVVICIALALVFKAHYEMATPAKRRSASRKAVPSKSLQIGYKEVRT